MLCLAHKFYEGAAIICELLGAHTAALAHRIEHIKRNVPSDEWKRALIQQLDNTMKNVELGALRSDMMYLVRCLLMIQLTFVTHCVICVHRSLKLGNH